MNPLVIAEGQSRRALPGTETGDVCLVHGFPDTPRSLVPLARRLSADATCALPTLRGYEECPRREPDLSIGRLGEDLVALAQRWGQGRPVTLVGHDWGAVSV